MSAAIPRHRPVEMVRLRWVDENFGYASVRLRGVLLNSIQIRVRADGSLHITAPSTTGRNGIVWPSFRLRPGDRKAVEAAIAQAVGCRRPETTAIIIELAPEAAPPDNRLIFEMPNPEPERPLQ